MPIPIPARLVEFVLLGPLDDRRQLQDSPILGDVWVEYARRPGAALDLLLSPYLHENAGKLAATIDDELHADAEEDEDARVAYVQGLVAARLTFTQLVRTVVPKTKWWSNQWSAAGSADGGARKGGAKKAGKKAAAGKKASAAPSDHSVLALLADEAELVAALEKTVESARRWHAQRPDSSLMEVPATSRFVALAGLLCWAAAAPDGDGGAERPVDEQVARVLERFDARDAARRLRELAGGTIEGSGTARPPVLVYLVARNRSATPALERSVPAVKADAATTLFEVDCSGIGWAVLDSGIDGRHEAFLDEAGKSRIEAAYDFEHFRKIVSLANARPGVRARNVGEILAKEGLVDPPSAAEADRDLERLAADARRQAPIPWEVVERYVRIEPTVPPASPHGTHVAGILGASNERSPGEHHGMCPSIKLYDFRILAPGLQDTEFAIIAAMQLIRYLNERGSLKAIQGANLSLSIPHDVRNFACGRTPICNEAERLINSGVVVVAAAGNHGYKNFQTLEGPYAGYAAFSITDPGNAESVITVGSTHRFWPHTYGVSFFSSRGPTGDGRVKPDLVAPGERIRAPLEGRDGGPGTWGDLDGTSMAAPHVSGAAAMLMARYSELIEQPRRIKEILCQTATDLRRERTFQGHGMLDVLRAFQSL